MRYRTTIICLIILSGVFPIKGKNSDFLGGKNDYIIWSKDYKLKWEDFQGNSDTARVIGADCASSIDDDEIPVRGKDSLKIIVRARFNKKESIKVEWRLKPFNLEDQSLQHEQIHFDITEVYARKFREILCKLIPKAQRRNSYWIISQMSEIYNKLFKQWQGEQKQFDKEVSFFHEINPSITGAIDQDLQVVKKKQEEWRQKVDKELNDLEKYSQDTFTIKVKKNTVM